MMKILVLLGLFCLSLAILPTYRVVNLRNTPNGQAAELHLQGGSGPFGDDIAQLNLNIFYESVDRVRIKITDKNEARWEVPANNIMSSTPHQSPPNVNYRVVVSDPFAILITRISDGEVIFDSSKEPFVYSKYYLSIGSSLPSDNPHIYGLGERVHNFRLDPRNRTYTLFNRDAFNVPFRNLYGSHPFLIEKRRDKFHGIFLFNSNAMDVTIKPFGINYKTIGGVLDFFFYMGPTSESVVQQYQQTTGRATFVPYWSLGWHHTRWGYKTIQETKSVVERYRQHRLPLDTMWNDIDYMDKFKLFTFDPVNYPIGVVREFVNQLHSNGQKYMMIVDPGVKVEQGYDVYEQGLRDHVYITKEDGKTPTQNKVWPGITVFPDFTSEKTYHYWDFFLKKFYSMVPYDGLWLDMNEIVGFCNGECNEGKDEVKSIAPVSKDTFDPDRPPYVPGREALYVNTIWLKSKTSISQEYNTHSLYAHLENNATRVSMDGFLKKRSLIVTRSSWAGTGHYSAKWGGDNESKWGDLFLSISSMLSMNIFGIPFTGSDICGFMGDTTEELCTRWHQLGAFYPFARNHNELKAKPQEPWIFGEVFVNRARAIMLERYSLIPYFYLYLYKAHAFGGTVIRSLAFEFPADPVPELNYLDRQFMVGPALLISPVLEQGAVRVNAYFPQGIWYDYYRGNEIENTGSWHQLDAPIDFIPVHIRGGHIIPKQTPALTTRDSRKNPFNILVALDSSLSANGELYIDDGESLDSASGKKFTLIEYKATSGKLESTIKHNGYNVDSNFIDQIKIYGAQNVCNVQLNGSPISSFRYDTETGVMEVYDQKIQLNTPFTLVWSC